MDSFFRDTEASTLSLRWQVENRQSNDETLPLSEKFMYHASACYSRRLQEEDPLFSRVIELVLYVEVFNVCVRRRTRQAFDACHLIISTNLF